jgi:hypothetical protein
MYPQLDQMEATARNDGSVRSDPRDILTKIGGLAGKASGEIASFFKVVGSQRRGRQKFRLASRNVRC